MLPPNKALDGKFTDMTTATHGYEAIDELRWLLLGGMNVAQ
jgi:hypothetical protein